jgi:hypothetical protein
MVLDLPIAAIARLDAVFACDLDGPPSEAFSQDVAIAFGIVRMDPRVPVVRRQLPFEAENLHHPVGNVEGVIGYVPVVNPLGDSLGDRNWLTRASVKLGTS